jgi:predicted PurR-regulated permease PerM
LNENIKQSAGGRFLVTAAAFVIVIAGMRAAESILVPFLIAVFIAVICLPSLSWLKNKGVPSALALLIVIAGISIIGMLMTALIGTSLDNFSKDLPFYQARLKEKSQLFISWVSQTGISIPEQKILDAFNPGAAMNLAAGILSRLGGVFTNAFLILLTVVFILLEASSISAKIHAISGSHEGSNSRFDEFINNINRYMAIKTMTSLATGICVAAWLAILGVNYPVLWGFLAFLLNYVPSIGSIIAAVPAILLALIQLGAAKTLFVVLGYLVVNIGIGSIIEPRVMGRGLGISTLVVFLSLIFWGWVLGPVGMLLSVPLTMAVKIALDSSEDTRRLGILLGSDVQAEPVRPAPVNDIGDKQDN